MPRKTKKISHNAPQWDEVFQMISWWDAERIAKSRIMVVGSGALGNEVLKNLALLNTGYIFLVDFDNIEYSNLSRSVLFRESDVGRPKVEVAAERIKAINPNVNIQTVHGDIMLDVGLGVFRRMDVVIGCLDNRIARLYINRYCHKVEKVWVDGAIENLSGQLDVYKPGISCYECQLTEQEWSIITYRLGCADVVQRNANFGRIPTTPISASIIGAMQVQEALKIVFNNTQNSLAGNRLQYEGMHNWVFQYKSPPLKPDCPSHMTLRNIVESDELSHKMTVRELLACLRKQLNCKNPAVLLDNEIVLELTMRQSNLQIPIVRMRGHISDAFLRQYRLAPGEDALISQNKSVAVLDASFPHLDMSLQEIGIPPLQILTVTTEDALFAVELTGDLAFLH